MCRSISSALVGHDTRWRRLEIFTDQALKGFYIFFRSTTTIPSCACHISCRPMSWGPELIKRDRNIEIEQYRDLLSNYKFSHMDDVTIMHARTEHNRKQTID
jgi:hypothetical protein